MTTPEPVAPAWPTRTSMETTAGVTLGGDVGHRAGLAGDAGVDLGQLRAGRQQRRLAVGPGEVPADAAAERADQQHGEQRRAPRAGSTGRAAGASCGPSASTTIGPVLGRPRRRRRARRARPGRTGRATGRCGRRASTTARWRCGGGPGRPPGGSCRPRWPGAGGPKARSSASAGGGGSGRGGGSRPVVGEAAVDGVGRPKAACWPGGRAGARSPARGVEPVGRVAERPPRPGRAREGGVAVGGGVLARGRRRPGGRPRCSGGPALAA